MIFWHEAAQMWWPQDDHDPKTAFEWVMKYIPDVDWIKRICTQHRTVVQAGGHVGLWPLRLATAFEKVHTFEIQPSLQECLTKNCAETKNIEVHHTGLGSHASHIVPMRRHCTAGSWRIDPAGDMMTKLITIDSLNLTDVDAIVLDIEGYEQAALMGAIRTIRQYRPLIYVEELPRSREITHNYISRLGYKEVKRIHRDTIYVHV